MARKRCGTGWNKAFEHNHIYGITDYYLMSGDETVEDAIFDGMSDRFLDQRINDNVGGKLWDTRAVGSQMMALARLYRFYQAIGDKDDVTTDSTDCRHHLAKAGIP